MLSLLCKYLKESFKRHSLISWLLLTFTEEIFFKELKRIATNKGC